MTSTPRDPREPCDVIVIGAGVGGLTTAWELARAGLSVRVLEAFAWPGGVVGRHTVDGLDLDAGADSYAVATPFVGDLIADLGEADKIAHPNPVGGWVRFDAGQAPLPKGGYLGIPADPLADDTVAILGEQAARRAAEDKALDPSVGWSTTGTTTLGQLVRARMGDLVVERLVEPVVGGVHSADPDLLDVDVIAPRLRAAFAKAGSLSAAIGEVRGGAGRAGSAVAGMTGGMHSLIDILAAQLGELGGLLDTGVEAERLDKTSDGWQVTTRPTPWLKQPVAGSIPAGATLHSRAVVLAVPGKAAGQLVAGLDPDAAALLADARSCQILLATLIVREPALDAHPRGTGILVSSHASGVRAKAITHATAKWADLAERAGQGRHVLRLSYGRDGAGIPPRDEALATALADATTLMGVELNESKLSASAMIRWDQAMPRADAQHLERVAALSALAEREETLAATGAFVAGTGLAAVVGHARATAQRLATL